MMMAIFRRSTGYVTQKIRRLSAGADLLLVTATCFNIQILLSKQVRYTNLLPLSCHLALAAMFLVLDLSAGLKTALSPVPAHIVRSFESTSEKVGHKVRHKLVQDSSTNECGAFKAN